MIEMIANMEYDNRKLSTWNRCSNTLDAWRGRRISAKSTKTEYLDDDKWLPYFAT